MPKRSGFGLERLGRLRDEAQIAAEHRATLSAFEAVPGPVCARDTWNVEGRSTRT
jgi:hypothetical protein